MSSGVEMASSEFEIACPVANCTVGRYNRGSRYRVFDHIRSNHTLDEIPSDFLISHSLEPCVYCQKPFVGSSLDRHMRRCVMRKQEAKETISTTSASLHMFVNRSVDIEAKETVDNYDIPIQIGHHSFFGYPSRDSSGVSGFPRLDTYSDREILYSVDTEWITKSIIVSVKMLLHVTKMFFENAVLWPCQEY